MYSQANTIKSYEEIRRVVGGGPILTLTQKSILTFFLLVGILGGLMLADCWGNIPTTQEQLQLQAQKSNGNMHLFLQQQLNPLNTTKTAGQFKQKVMTKTGMTPAQLRHQRQNEKLRKRIQARKAFLKEKRKCKVAKILFLVSLSKPLNKP
jgi:hypothetical protein